MWMVGPLVFFTHSPLQANSPVTSSPCINLNTANQSTLETLPGVGPVLAKRILAFRIRHNGFKRKIELLNVQGIGPQRFEKLKPLVCVQSPASSSTSKYGSATSREKNA